MTQEEQLYFEQTKLYLDQCINSQKHFEESIRNLEATIAIDTENICLIKKRIRLNEVQIDIAKSNLDGLISKYKEDDTLNTTE